MLRLDCLYTGVVYTITIDNWQLYISVRHKSTTNFMNVKHHWHSFSMFSINVCLTQCQLCKILCVFMIICQTEWAHSFGHNKCLFTLKVKKKGKLQVHVTCEMSIRGNAIFSPVGLDVKRHSPNETFTPY